MTVTDQAHLFLQCVTAAQKRKLLNIFSCSMYAPFRDDMIHQLSQLCTKKNNAIQITESLLLRVTISATHLTEQSKSSCFSFYPNVTTLRSGLCCRRSVCRLSVVCLSVTLVHPTQGLKLPAIFFHRCVRWPSSDLRAKFYEDSPRGTPPSGALNARGVSK